MPIVVQLQTTRERRAPWEKEGYNLEVDLPDHDSFASVCAALQEGALLIGEELIHRRGDAPGERIVTARRPIALAPSAVALVNVPDWTLVERSAAQACA